ncbi:MAG TPA: dethiobiotin synthase [Nocardioidaceae bacterium]|nr:dethiobiotin synthase [Nocardioidaceae bacterium]
MSLPRVLVVTGTDTEVGKTVVTAALAACLAPDRPVAVFKPAQTGVGSSDPGDVDEVRRLSGVTAVHEGVRLRHPLAPTVAARLAGVPLPSVAEHAESVHRLAATHGTVLVEGAGGVLVGLDGAGANLADLASRLTLPVAFVVVARAGLGTLNHTGLTVEALRARDQTVLGVVVGAVPDRPGLAERTNLDGLAEVTGVPVLGKVPSGAGRLPPESFRSVARTWFTPPIGDA